jgi:hypothetical protein
MNFINNLLILSLLNFKKGESQLAHGLDINLLYSFI